MNPSDRVVVGLGAVAVGAAVALVYLVVALVFGRGPL